MATYSSCTTNITMKHGARGCLFLVALIGVLGCATSPGAADMEKPEPAADLAAPQPAADTDKMTSALRERMKRLPGYLPDDAIPDSRLLAAPAPETDSAAQSMDDEASRRYLALKGSARWKLATQDAVLEPGQVFSCALETTLSEQTTPVLYKLLQRTLWDGAKSTSAAKDYYKRPRPFMVNGQPTCTPEAEGHLHHNGSYPSGHSAIGWLWALLLAELSPDHADAVLVRGRAFALSRAVCNVHWRSDTIEGMIMGAATAARLRAEPAFVEDMAIARKELAAVRLDGAPVSQDCAAQAEELSKL